jgi:hypothetical protein
MPKNSMLTFGRNVRTAAGFMIIVAGLLGGVWLGWWLAFRGNIVEIIHDAKMSLPGWAWLALKYGLSLAGGALFVVFFLILGMIVLGGGGQNSGRP